MRRMKYSDVSINVSIVILSLLGIVMIGSASAGDASYLGTEYAIENMLKQFVFVIVGYVVMSLIRRKFNMKYVNNRTITLCYIIMILLMFGCLFFEPVNGSRAWIRFGEAFTIQPSEFSKILIILMLSYMLSETPKAFSVTISFRNAQDKKNFDRIRLIECLIKPIGLSLILCAITMLLQKDFGTAIIMLFIIIVCLFSSNQQYYKKIHFILFSFVLVILFIGLFVLICFPNLVQSILSGYQGARITAWLNPFSNIQGDSYQIVNGLLSFVRGGVWGVGLTNSTLKYGYIPEAHNDYITAIICEELGLVGLGLILIPYSIIIFKLANYAMQIKEPKEKIVLMGVAAFFFIHLFFNLGGVSGLIPMTGVPLLCVSSGGSGVWAAYIALGVAQAIIAKNKRLNLIK